MKKKKNSKVLVMFAYLLLVSGCGGSWHESIPATEPQPVLSVCGNPIVVGVAIDQSGSMRWSGTAPISTADLKPLIEHIRDCGGEIGVTFVRANSGKPIERLRANEPPALPTEPVQTTAEEDYEFADRQDDHRQKLETRNTAIMEYRKEFEPKMATYLDDLAPLLAHKPKGSTDLWTGLNRLDVFLSEDALPWRTEPHRYLLVASDGADSVGKEKHRFKSDATVIWVNASASERHLKDVPYKRVEDSAAAVRYILAAEGVK